LVFILFEKINREFLYRALLVHQKNLMHLVGAFLKRFNTSQNII